MCTRIYPGLSKEFTFNIGGEVIPGNVGNAVGDISSDLTRSGQIFADQLAMEVKSITRRAAARIDAP